MIETTIQILVVDEDAILHDEVTAAADALRRTRTVVLRARGLKDGIAAARNRSPDLIVIELCDDPAAIQDFTRNVAHVAPEAIVVGAYRADSGSEGGSDGRLLVAALRSRVRDFLRRPVSSTELQEVIDRHLDAKATVERRASRGIVVDFVSNKGGVGKSTVSINTACLLGQRHPGRVLLIDASLQLGVCAPALDITPKATIVDVVRELPRLDETLLREFSVRHSCGLHVLAAPNDAVEAACVGEVEISRILTIARKAFDYVVIDTFPLVDAIAVAGLDVSDLVYCITSDNVPNLIGTARYMTVLERLGVTRRRMRLVLNHPQPNFSGALTPVDVATRLDRDVDHVIPFDRGVLVGLNSGTPYSLRAAKWYGFGKAMLRLALEVESVQPSTREEPPAPPPPAPPRRELVESEV